VAPGLVLAGCGLDGGGATDAPIRSSSPGASFGLTAEPDLFSPPALTSANGLLQAELSVAPAMVPYEGGTRWALTVNGTTPGPTLRVKPGDILRVLLNNRTEHSTNLHTHGLHVSPQGNSDNPFIEVRPGERFLYEFAIPEDQPGGLFWYHPHVHHHVAEQVFAGFFGAIIVEDDFDALSEVAAATERLLILHDIRPGNSEADVMSASMMEHMMGREGSAVLVNGFLRPTLHATAGGLERWRILNASPSRYYSLGLRDHDFHVIGLDGTRLGQAVRRNSLLLVPGERVEALVEAEGPGEFTLRTAAVNRGSMGMGMGMGMGGETASGAADILTLSVEGEGRRGSGLPQLPPARPDLAAQPIAATREVTFSMQGMSFLIDGRPFEMSRTDVRARLGTTEEWTIRNVSTMDHPFHLHVWPFQVVAQSKGLPPPGWKDVVNVPAGGWVKIRVRFDSFAGRTVYHCHILDHEDMGMMATIEVA
jgi:FtsP/CotA-like multicopper oxidase with cupredoxin domain